MVEQNVDSHVNLGKTSCLVIKSISKIHEMGEAMAFPVHPGGRYILVPV